jgi:hypothetical protein
MAIPDGDGPKLGVGFHLHICRDVAGDFELADDGVISQPPLYSGVEPNGVVVRYIDPDLDGCPLSNIMKYNL